MTPFKKLLMAALLASSTTALLVACGGDDDGPAPTPDVTAQVPAAAATSPSVATSYVGELAAVPPSTTDTLEPVDVPEMLASDDSAEPSTVN